MNANDMYTNMSWCFMSFFLQNMAPKMASPIRGMVFILSLRVHRGVWPALQLPIASPVSQRVSQRLAVLAGFVLIRVSSKENFTAFQAQWKVVFPTSMIQLLLARAWAGQVLWCRILSTKMTGKRIPSCLPYISLDLSEFISSYIIHIRISMVTSCKCSAWNDLVFCFSDFSVLTILIIFIYFLRTV